jgi:hypothetical protein
MKKSVFKSVIFPVRYDSREVDVAVAFRHNNEGNVEVAVTHEAVDDEGLNHRWTSFSNASPDSTGMYLTTEHLVNGGEWISIHHSNLPRNVETAAWRHFEIYLTKSLGVVADQAETFTLEVEESVVLAIQELASNPETLGEIPERCRLLAKGPWEVSSSSWPPVWTAGQVSLMPYDRIQA